MLCILFVALSVVMWLKLPSFRADHEYTEAVEGYTKAIALNPTNAVYYANRAAAHIHLENFGCALTDASKAIELDPKYTKVKLCSDVWSAAVPPNTQAGGRPEHRNMPNDFEDEPHVTVAHHAKRCRSDSQPVSPLWSGLEGRFTSRPGRKDRQVIWGRPGHQSPDLSSQSILVSVCSAEHCSTVPTMTMSAVPIVVPKGCITSFTRTAVAMLDEDAWCCKASTTIVLAVLIMAPEERSDVVLWHLLMRVPVVLQGIYRRADANVGLGRMKKALIDYKRAAQVNPRDPDLRKKLTQCDKEVKRIRFEEAVATPVSLQLLLHKGLYCIQSLLQDQAVMAHFSHHV